MIRKNSIHFSCSIQALNTAPKSLSARGGVAFSPKMSSHCTNHKHCFPQCGRLFRSNRCFLGIGAECFSFYILEEDGAGYFRSLTAEHRQVIYSPGHNHVNTKTGLNTIGCAELAVFYPTATFQGAMINLYPPTTRIPFDTLCCITEVRNFRCRQRHPFNWRWDFFWPRLLLNIYRPYLYRGIRSTTARGDSTQFL